VTEEENRLQIKWQIKHVIFEVYLATGESNVHDNVSKVWDPGNVGVVMLAVCAFTFLPAAEWGLFINPTPSLRLELCYFTWPFFGIS